jgi:hypothetical protein
MGFNLPFESGPESPVSGCMGSYDSLGIPLHNVKKVTSGSDY